MVQMRFRFYDESGHERQADTPEALADAVERGQIGPKTLIYDNLEGGWVRAEEHDATHLAVAARLALGYDPKADLAPAKRGAGPASKQNGKHNSGAKRAAAGPRQGPGPLRRVLGLLALAAVAALAVELLGVG